MKCFNKEITLLKIILTIRPTNKSFYALIKKNKLVFFQLNTKNIYYYYYLIIYFDNIIKLQVSCDCIQTVPGGQLRIWALPD